MNNRLTPVNPETLGLVAASITTAIQKDDLQRTPKGDLIPVPLEWIGRTVGSLAIYRQATRPNTY